MIFSSSLVLFTSCGGYPKGLLHAIDTNHNVAIVREIKEFNKEACELVLEKKPDVPLCVLDADGRATMNPYFNGGVFVTKEYYSDLKAKAKSDCQNKKKTEDK